MVISHFHISVLADLIVVGSKGSHSIKLNHLEIQRKHGPM